MKLGRKVSMVQRGGEGVGVPKVLVWGLHLRGRQRRIKIRGDELATFSMRPLMR